MASRRIAQGGFSSYLPDRQLLSITWTNGTTVWPKVEARRQFESQNGREGVRWEQRED